MEENSFNGIFEKFGICKITDKAVLTEKPLIREKFIISPA